MLSPRIRALPVAASVMLFALVPCAMALIPATAAAQVSQISELWREWAVLEQQWRVEHAEMETDRERLRARREGRDPDADRKKTSAPAGRR